jgi:SAM-dependent methyltransferase
MAVNWKDAQKAEKRFWDLIYLDEAKDISSYEKISFASGINFLTKIMHRHQVDMRHFSKKSVVDLGCGPYGLIYGLAHLSNLGFCSDSKIYGVDPLIKHYKKYQTFPESENLTLINAKGEDTGISDGTIDYVFSTNVVDHVDDPNAVIKEVRRILKKDGKFCVSCHVLYPVYAPISHLFKYIDVNHPHHFTFNVLEEMLKKHFDKVTHSYTSTMVEDQPDFAPSRILKSPNIKRGLKRVLSNYILKSVYFNCQ